MNILIIHQHYFPEMSGTARRAKELAEHFVKQKHNVSVLTSFPREYRSIPGQSYKKNQILNRVKIHRVNNIFEVKNNVFLRMLSYFTFVIMSIQSGLRLSNKSDIIITIAPLSSGIIGATIRMFNKKYHHFDIPDILPDLGISAGMITNRFIIYILRKLELWVYARCDSISTCTNGQMKNIEEKGVPINKLSCIPDWVDTDFFNINHIKFKDEVSSLYAYPNKKILSFVGNIGALQNPSIFIDLMSTLKEKEKDDYIFLFIGDGIMLPKLKKLVDRKKLDNIKFLGRVKREYIPSIMKMSDILVTNYVSDEHLNLYIPGKLFEYAISERPIVIGARGDSKKFIEKYKLGLVVEPSNYLNFKHAIINISENIYKFEPKINEFSNDFSINNVANKYQIIFEKIIKKT